VKLKGAAGARRQGSRDEPALPADLHDRIGQMTLVGFRGATPSEAEPTLRRIRDGFIGAVELFDADAETGGGRNIQSPDQVRELIGVIKAAGRIAPLVTVDAEGGFYHRLKERHGFPPVAQASDVGHRNDLGFTARNATVIAEMLADIGVDMNLAPVVDLQNPSHTTAGSSRRSFSADPATVTAHAREFIRAHRERGILIALKHFPGMAGVLRPYVPGTGELIEEWSAAELDPYRVLVGEGLADAVMATRVTHPLVDPEFPGCLSARTIDGLLRTEIGYDGVVISDAMEMLAIWDGFGFGRGTILAVNAGVDLLMFCNESRMVPYSDDRVEETVQVISDAVACGEIPESRINDSCRRILRLKARRGRRAAA
jgi:beta-N-acetylhexosaminidase